MAAMRLSLLLLVLLMGPAQAATAYRVQDGDTLIGIAQRAGVSVQQIRALNASLKKSSVVKVGRVISIPNRRVAARKYHVRSGENLTSIAHSFGMSAGELLRANPEYRGNRSVWAGAIITIPPRVVAAGLERSAGLTRLGGGQATLHMASIRVSAAQDDTPSPAVPDSGRWRWPLPGYHYVSSGFGERELDGKEGMHYGLDIVAPIGTPVLAARSGRVLESRNDARRGWGWTVVLKHPDGWITRYAHLSQNLVKAGELVQQGQRVGRVGNTGHSTGPHLHYGTYLRWHPKDPMGLY